MSIFSSKTLSKKPLGKCDSTSFDVTKVNAELKAQKRRLCFSDDGIRNMDGESVKWFVPKQSILGLFPTKNTDTEFTLALLQQYTFYAETPEQRNRILETQKLYNLQNPHFGIVDARPIPHHPSFSASFLDDPDNPAPRRMMVSSLVPTSGPTPTVPSATQHPHEKPEPPSPQKKIPIGFSITPEMNTKTLADFNLMHVVGKGSFGKVLQVQHIPDGQIYAMKILRKHRLWKTRNMFHVQTERTVMAMYSNHPFMSRLHYAFQTPDKLYMILDYANGGEMFHHLKLSHRFPLNLATFYIAEVCTVIHHLHRHSIVFRDLKPENVLIDPEGHVMLIDFGLAKIGVDSVGGKTAPGATTDTYCGTAEYLAPEILRGDPHGLAVDWWNVGTLFYTMCIGSQPFWARSDFEMKQKIAECCYSLPRELHPDARDFIQRLLVPQPQKRLGSITAPATSSSTSTSTTPSTTSTSLPFGSDVPGEEAIFAHPLFASIDWKRIITKQFKPPCKPELKRGIFDLSHIDAEFRAEPAIDSPTPQDETAERFAEKFPDKFQEWERHWMGFDFNKEIMEQQLKEKEKKLKMAEIAKLEEAEKEKEKEKGREKEEEKEGKIDNEKEKTLLEGDEKQGTDQSTEELQATMPESPGITL